ncbi:MAG: hypothetical protein KF764_10740 [Labilithrix sp.]|nr:hypothetical protein [Labilithrix sp.]MBX3222426.1 hypothetical protein [Labilithrix sp.]
MHPARLLPFCASLVLFTCVASCDSREGDLPSPTFVPPPAGKDRRIHEIRDPESPSKAAHRTQVQVSGAVVVAVDQFDETRNGRSAGTIYVQDLGSKEPYSGISLFNPSFIPGNLRVGAGDALDLRGEFQENQDIPIKFAPGAFLVQLSNAIGTFRFDADVPAPVEIDIDDLADYAKGGKWLNMLVTVKNVTVHGNPFGGGGRRSYNLLPQITSGPVACDAPFPKVPTLVNALADLAPLELTDQTVIKSVTGVVTFFCNLQIAPRSVADVVL